MNLSLRVVSYNVLSSHLASPTHFTALVPEHLEAKNRLPHLLRKLEEEMELAKKQTQNRCVICLQEVSYDWAGDFHTFFANHGYHMVTGLYGKKFNGYMGVAMAWPIAVFETENVDISRLSDTKRWPRSDDETELNVFQQFWEGYLTPMVNVPLRLLGLKEETHQTEPYDYSQGRFNVLVTATLRDKKTGKSFCIGNYHMPCAFYAPMVMTIHCEMACALVQKLAKENPYILAGDFNIKPTDSMYTLITTGKMDKEDPAYPTPKYGENWQPNIKNMRSAYAVSGWGEPDFTNFAKVRDNDPFVDTLDYIFLSPEWDVLGVKSLPNRNVANGPFPNLDEGEPSDHVLISASLSCPVESSFASS